MITSNENKIKSFGKIYTNVFADNKLSAKAKGLYAYLCSYAGSNMVAYPSQENMLYELQISKKTFYKYVEELINKNYISREIQSSFKHTHYIINVQDSNYGIVEKDVMRSGIDILSKAIYGYICAFSGIYNAATLCLDNILNHLNIVYNTFRKGFQAIKNLISVKHEDYCNSTYSVSSREPKENNSPKKKKRNVKKSDKPKQLPKSEINSDYIAVEKPQHFNFSTVKNSTVKNSTVKNYSTNNNSIHNNNLYNNNLHHSKTETQIVTRQEILNQVGLTDDEEDATSKSVIDVMFQAYNSKNETLTVAKTLTSKEVIVKELKKIMPAIFKEVVRTINESKEKIYNIRAYILTVLFNAPMQYNVYQQNECKPSYDIYEYEQYDMFDDEYEQTNEVNNTELQPEQTNNCFETKKILSDVPYRDLKNGEYTVADGITDINCFSFTDNAKDDLRKLTLYNSVQEISNYAFEGCYNLRYIYIPSITTKIGKDAFKGCHYLTIYCQKGSYAEQYAIENNIDYSYIE